MIDDLEMAQLALYRFSLGRIEYLVVQNNLRPARSLCRAVHPNEARRVLREHLTDNHAAFNKMLHSSLITSKWPPQLIDHARGKRMIDSIIEDVLQGKFQILATNIHVLIRASTVTIKPASLLQIDDSEPLISNPFRSDQASVPISNHHEGIGKWPGDAVAQQEALLVAARVATPFCEVCESSENRVSAARWHDFGDVSA